MSLDNTNREGMLFAIKKVNEIDSELRSIILWLNYLGYPTFSCCAGHPKQYTDKRTTYDLFGYIHFSKSPNLNKTLNLLEQNGFEITKDKYHVFARITFIKVKNGKLKYHYKNHNRFNLTKKEIADFWIRIFDEIKYKLKI